MTTPLQITRYDRVVRRLMNLVGEGALVTGVLEDVFPVLQLEDLQPDAWKWAGWNITAGTAFQGAVVGEQARISLDNPPDSGKVGVITKILVNSSTASNAVGSVAEVALRAGTNQGRNRDTRFSPFPIAQVPVLTIFRETDALAPTEAALFAFRLVANTTVQLDVPDGIAVIGPGTQFRMHSTVANATLDVSYFWRERRLDPAEFT